ncbi:MAG: sterol desaturase family protein [Pseudomonadota bacterium]
MTLVLTLITVVVLGTLLVVERCKPALERSGGRGRLFRNVTLGALGSLLTFAVVTPLSLLFSTLGPDWRAGWPPVVRVGSDILLLDLFIYAWHRANHEIPFLWRFHRVHHFDGFLDVTSALRFHPGEVLLSVVVRGALIITMDIAALSILLFDALVILSAAFHHSNVRLTQSTDDLLRQVMVTPNHHRVHHIDNRTDTDSNYGTIFSLWDRLFKSYRSAPNPGKYGVEGETDKPLRQLLINPLQ